jgi:hypothetical protein
MSGKGGVKYRRDRIPEESSGSKLSGVRKAVEALLVADLHLSHKPPLARSAEPDWYSAMERQLAELEGLQVTLGVPVLVAGDIFDRWDSPAELITFAIRRLPEEMYAIPGQHDLPYHNYADIHRSSYATLIEAGKIHVLKSNNSVEVGALRLHGFPWGFPVTPLKEKKNDLLMDVAVIHDYLWKRGEKHGTGYPGAPPDKHWTRHWKNLRGYNLGVFGDNHVPVEVRCATGACRIFNVGGFFRRKADEKGHKPSVGLLHSDGTVTRHYLDCRKDKWIDVPEGVETLLGSTGMQGLVEAFADLGDCALDFAERIRRTLDGEKVSEEVKRLVLNWLEVKK